MTKRELFENVRPLIDQMFEKMEILMFDNWEDCEYHDDYSKRISNLEDLIEEKELNFSIKKKFDNFVSVGKVKFEENTDDNYFFVEIYYIIDKELLEKELERLLHVVSQ